MRDALFSGLVTSFQLPRSVQDLLSGTMIGPRRQALQHDIQPSVLRIWFGLGLVASVWIALTGTYMYGAVPVDFEKGFTSFRQVDSLFLQSQLGVKAAPIFLRERPGLTILQTRERSWAVARYYCRSQSVGNRRYRRKAPHREYNYQFSLVFGLDRADKRAGRRNHSDDAMELWICCLQSVLLIRGHLATPRHLCCRWRYSQGWPAPLARRVRRGTAQAATAPAENGGG